MNELDALFYAVDTMIAKRDELAIRARVRHPGATQQMADSLVVGSIHIMLDMIRLRASELGVSARVVDAWVERSKNFMH
jgi:hypothetical protein